MKIKDLVGYSGEVWDGEKWSHGDILYSGKKQKCIVSGYCNEFRDINKEKYDNGTV